MDERLESGAIEGPAAAGEGTGAVVAAYALTPLQHAMLLRSRRDPRGGFYIQQFVCTLREPIDAAALRDAWQSLHDRNSVLRTSFLMDAVPEPLQRVHAQARIAWREHDLRALPPEAQDELFQAFLREDRATPFVLEAAPLARFTLFRTEDEAYRLVWTSHHALLDGHARRLLLREAFGEYDARVTGDAFTPPARRAFAEYVGWLARAEPADARAFWERELRGFTVPNAVAPPAPSGAGPETRERHRFTLSPELTGALSRLAHRKELTLNTVLQGAWALLVSRRTGDRDVVFGAARACRRGGFPDAGEVVGLLSNTVPVRVRLDPECTVTRYLREIRRAWVRLRPYERTSLARVQEWSGVPRGTPLFQTLLSYETHTPQDALRRAGGERWRHRGLDLLQWVDYPLAVVAYGGAALTIDVVHDPARLSVDEVRGMGEQLTAILHAFAASPAQSLSRVLGGAEGARGAAEAGSARVAARLHVNGAAAVHPERMEPAAEPAFSAAEQALSRIWCEILGVPSVDPDQPLRDLGGHSLLAFRIQARIAAELGVAVPPRVLLGNGTLRSVAALVERAEPGADAAPPERVPRDGPLPLSHAQEAAWFFERLSPGLRAYRFHATLRLRGPLDVPVLERALEAIVRRHEIYRTTFGAVDGTPAQRIHPPWPVRLRVTGADAGSAEEREDAAREAVRRAFQEPLDAAALPLVRWSLVRLAADDHLLVIAEHHFVHDGWSFGVFLRELRAHYLAGVEGRDPDLPPPVQFADFAAWQRRWMQGAAAEAQLRFWEQALAGAPPLQLPTDAPRPAVLRFRGATERVRLAPGLAREARAFARGQGATFFATLLAAFQALLGRWSGQADFCVGSGLGGRTRAWMEEVMGMVVNTVALRADLKDDPTGRELLRRVRETTLRAYENQEVPFDQVVRRIQPARSTGALPVYQVAFSFHDARMAGPAWGPLRLGLHEAHENGASKLELNVIVIPRAEQGMGDDDEVEMVWEYDTDLFEPGTVRRMIGHFQALLAGLVRTPELRLSALPMMGDDERRLAVEAWNRTDAPYPASRCIHQLFQAQAAATPDAVAIVHEDTSLTYRALNERANRLAHRLMALGVGPEARVGVCLERGPQLVAALLAVLKAGGAYVPLDPAYPPERLALILADAASPVLVTQASLRGLLPDTDGTAVVLVDDAGEAAGSAENPRVEVPPAALAYLIYTSGSTGRPKGVAIEHRSAVAMLAWAWSVYPAEELGGMLASTSICFDMSVFELFAPLTRGGRIILVENALALPRCAAAGEVRLLDTVPSAAAALLETDGLPRGVRTVNLGGEPLSPELVDALYARGVERVYDLYGPSEDTTFTTFALRAPGGPATIGGPVDNTRVYVLDAALRPVPLGVEGELFTGGAGITRGYLGGPGLTAERYVPDPLGPEPGARLYRTGDRVRRRADGTLEYRGRWDAQVKIRGFRVEPGEVEAVLRRHPAVAECAVVAREDAPGERRLVAYVAGAVDAGELRAHLRRAVPEHLVPAAFVILDRLPLTPNGKVDRRALPAPGAAGARPDAPAPETPAERTLAALWAEVLRVERVGVNENFFELGGDSLRLAALQARLEKALGREVALAQLIRHPTVRAFHASLASADAAAARPSPAPASPASPAAGSAAPREARVEAAPSIPSSPHPPGAVAIVGMAGRFPGAETLDALWRLVAEGREGITEWDEDELGAAGVSRALLDDPAYVRRMGVLRDPAGFDAAFFGYAPREAETLEPAHRAFLETAWEALEDAGCDPLRFAGAVGVYAGCGEPWYTQSRVLARPELVAALGRHQVTIGSSKDFFATRVAYKLDLRGPAMTVQTGCSTSLVAVHAAVKALQAWECDLALAGGAAVPPWREGYLWSPGGILSPDGRCRPFDADAAGTVTGSGAGAVALKRLDDALRDGDAVRAVILGSAVNNDGGLKLAFTAPSVQGQAAAIGAALAAAGVHPETVRYVEGHGSGTELGDPVEIAALAEAFAAHTDRTGFCAVGSIKGNIGHADAAAGVAGLIRAVLALQHRTLPPTAHFRAPNPRIDFSRSPFYASGRAEPWEAGAAPRRAGVSSFGIGGTNAHLVLQEAPAPVPSHPRRPWHLLVLSARTEAALDAATERLAEHLRRHPAPLQDVAHTLQTGRRAMEHRRVLVVREGEDAPRLLQERRPDRVLTARADEARPSVVFLFPGLGDQYPQMGRRLYETEPVFRREVDRCAALLRERAGMDLLEALYPGPAPAEAEGAARIDLRGMLGRGDEAPSAGLSRTALAHPAVFAVEWALARLWMSWGMVPAAVAGHSLGEYAAAAVAGVMELEDALALVVERARLVETLPAGAMLSVPLPAAEAEAFLEEGTCLAAVNAPALCTVSGTPEGVERVRARLAGAGHAARPVAAEHAFHSPAMEPLVAPLRELAGRMTLSPPRIPLVSTATGAWITPAQATDPEHWAAHLRRTVRWDAAVDTLLADPDRILLEVGPGQTLGTFVRQRPDAAGIPIIPTLRHAWDRTADTAFLLGALGRLWLAGATPDWAALHEGEGARRIPLPTYPWEHRRYWLELPAAAPASSASAARSASADQSAASAEAAESAETASSLDERADGDAHPPGTDAERVVAELWRDLLGVERLGAHDDFFALGGHSLLGTQIVSRLRARFGLELPLRTVFEAPTVAGYAALLEDALLERIETLDDDELFTLAGSPA